MESANESKEYKSIFNSTFLFGFVQVVNIIVKVITNKVVAILLGAEGMGLIGLYNNTITLLKTGGGLGLSQSAVRDISEANISDDTKKTSKVIQIIQKAICFTSLLGCIITIALAPWLSEWILGDENHVFTFLILSIVVGVNILTEGKLAILKGMRQLRSLAKASMIGSVVGLLITLPIYYFWLEKGIIPSLLVTAFSALFFSEYFVKKITNIQHIKVSFRDLFKETTPMVNMGIGLMLSSFLASIASLIISVIIRYLGDLEEVGFYNAGITITQGYFGIVITALTTDYYPRIAAINKDNERLAKELNRQSSVSLILCCPLIVLFILLLPIFVRILYNVDFYPTVNFVRFGMLGVLITVCSNQIDMILIAKFKTKIFLTVSFFYRICQILISILLYKYYGLLGSGMALSIMGVLHMLSMSIIVYHLFQIRYDNQFVKIAMMVLLFFLLSFLLSFMDNIWIKIGIGFVLFLFSSKYSFWVIERKFGINISSFIKK